MTDATPTSSPAATPIAIVGIGCLFPKADSPGRYWANLRDGVDAITDVPKTHWAPEDHYDPDPAAADKVYAKRGGFLSPVDFEPLKFGIAPRDLEATDTTQLLALHVASAALDDAGYGEGGKDFDRARTGVVLGVTGALELVIPLGARLGHPIWRRALQEAGVDAQTAADVVQRISDSYVPWQENSFPGLLGNVTAGRIANRLDLHGTNCVVDAACASSLSALHLAMLELQTGRADLMLSGGVDAFNDVFMYTCFSKTPALSKTGDARPFAQGADGTMLGEGVGVVVLKRLEDAQRDGDRVYAVIRGMGAASDGKGQAIYAPDSEGQARALRQAYEVAQTDPATIELVEGHGTGTRVGDATELRGLASVYANAQREGQGPQGHPQEQEPVQRPWCALGSVKSMIGHTKAAAGVAGLIKASLSLYHRVLPPTLKVDTPNEALDEAPAFYINGSKRPWMRTGEHPRRAAVSAFGFGGSNFHCVLEEPQDERREVAWDGDLQIIALSGADRPALQAALRAFPTAGSWAQLRIAAHASRRAFQTADACRVSVVVQRGDDVAARLQQAADAVGSQLARRWSLPTGVTFGEGAATGRLAALFPGQGAQAVGMLSDLCCMFPVMANTVGAVLEDLPDVRAALYPPHAWSEDARAQAEDRITQTQNAQPALGAVSMGALAVLRSFGVEPTAAVGHSYGELSALCATGTLPLAAFGKVSRTRGDLMAGDGGDRGAMLACVCGLEELQGHLDRAGLGEVVIANRNAPTQMVCSGATADIEAAEEALRAAGVRVRRLSVAAGFHSPQVSAAQRPFEESLGFVRFADPAFDVYANATAKPYEGSESDMRGLLARQIAAPVEFVQCVERMVADGVDTFVEVGPGRRLSGLVSQIATDAVMTTAVDSSAGRQDGVLDLAKCLASLAAWGHAVSLGAWDPNVVVPSKDAKPVLRVPVSGANAKPKPVARAAPPARPQVHVAPTPTQQVPRSNPETAAPTDPRVGARPQAAAPVPTSTPHSMPSPHTAAAPASGAFAALLELQAQTARLHQQFLEGQERALRAFGALGVASSSTGAARMPAPSMPVAPAQAPPPSVAAPVAAAVPPVVAPVPPKAAPAATSVKQAGVRELVLAVVAEKTGYPVEMLEPSMGLDADLGIDSIKRVEILSTVQERRPELPAIGPEQLGTLTTLQHVIDHLGGDSAAATVPQATPATPVKQAGVRELVLAVVAEKTGYPVEMLEPSMGLDADLGIDSIKRVEILSTVQERRPELPAIGPEQLGTLRTLQNVIDHLGADAAATPRMPQSSGVRELVLAVVAEKTGYPVEMLEPSMGLDADLGIDSIKRVEILSTVQERRPELPAIGPEQLGTLQTLQNVIDHLGGGASAQATPAAPLPAVGQATPGATDITQTVLSVVADKTGYPVDMLALDMGLDADLGIDSIKRVEILSALQERLPHAPVVSPEQLGTLQTLGDVAGFLASGATFQTAPIVAAAAPTVAPAAGLDRYEVQWAAEAPARPSPRLLRAGPLYVLGSVPSVVAALKTAGHNPHPLVALPLPGDAAGLVIVAPQAPGDAWAAETFANVRSARANLRGTSEAAPVLVFVSRMGGRFGVDGGDFDPRGGALAGLAKTAAREWSDVCVHAVDGDAELSEASLGAAFAKLGHTDAVELGEGAGTVGLRHSSAAHVEAGPTLSAGDVVVVTGGARGVTAAVAQAMARRWGCTMVLLGRSPAPAEAPAHLAGLRDEAEIRAAVLAQPDAPRTPAALASAVRAACGAAEIRASLATLRSVGGACEYHAVDVRDASALASLVADVTARLGPIRGVVHGAGVLADKVITDKTDEDFARVYGTKVEGAEHLLASVSTQDLRVVVVFSSSTARFGRVGQADYAMANEVLNKTAQRLRTSAPHVRVAAVGWGPWDGGMVTPGLAKLFASEGVQTIGLDAGAQLLVHELEGSGPAEVVVLGGGSRLDGAVFLPEAGASSDASQPATTTPLMVGGGQTVFERTLGVADHPFLASHALGGKAVLPAAMMVEWFAHAALAQHPGLRFGGLDDLEVFRGVRMGRNERIAVRIEAGTPEHGGGDVCVPLELCSGGENGRRVLHARARVRLVETSPVQGAPAPLGALPAFTESVQTVYANRLFHGAAFQGITSIDGMAGEGINATLRAAPRPKEWMQAPVRGRWITEPLAIDCGLQAVIVWSATQAGTPSLPSRIGAYRQFLPFPKGGAKLGVRIAKQTPSRVVADLSWVDAEGRLLASMEGSEFTMDAGLSGAFLRNQVE